MLTKKRGMSLFLSIEIINDKIYTRRTYHDYHSELFEMSPLEYINSLQIFNSKTLTYSDLQRATCAKKIRLQACLTPTELWQPLDIDRHYWINLFGYSSYKENYPFGICCLEYKIDNQTIFFELGKRFSYSTKSQSQTIQKILAEMVVFMPHLLLDDKWLKKNPRLLKAKKRFDKDFVTTRHNRTHAPFFKWLKRYQSAYHILKQEGYDFPLRS